MRPRGWALNIVLFEGKKVAGGRDSIFNALQQRFDSRPLVYYFRFEDPVLADFTAFLVLDLFYGNLCARIAERSKSSFEGSMYGDESEPIMAVIGPAGRVCVERNGEWPVDIRSCW